MTTINASFVAPAMRPAALRIALRPLLSDTAWPFGTDPGFDLIELGGGRYRLTLDVAGYDENDLSVEQYPDALVVSGDETGERSNGSGHARFRQSFRRAFPLPESARVTGTELRNGLLSLDLQADARRMDHPVRIPISTSNSEGALNRLRSGVTSLIRRLADRLG